MAAADYIPSSAISTVPARMRTGGWVMASGG